MCDFGAIALGAVLSFALIVPIVFALDLLEWRRWKRDRLAEYREDRRIREDARARRIEASRLEWEASQ